MVRHGNTDVELAQGGPPGAQHAFARASAAPGDGQQLASVDEDIHLSALTPTRVWWKRPINIVLCIAFLVLSGTVLAWLLSDAQSRGTSTSARTVSRVAFASCTQRFNGPNPIWEQVRCNITMACWPAKQCVRVLRPCVHSQLPQTWCQTMTVASC
jgi:hypothetical protein